MMNHLQAAHTVHSSDCTSTHFMNTTLSQPSYAISYDEYEEIPNGSSEGVSITPVPRGGQRTAVWSDDDVAALLDFVFDHQSLINDKLTKKKKVWASITTKLNNFLGTSFTSDQANAKYRTWLSRYRDYITKNSNTIDGARPVPKFFLQMHKIVEEAHSITLSHSREVGNSEFPTIYKSAANINVETTPNSITTVQGNLSPNSGSTSSGSRTPIYTNTSVNIGTVPTCSRSSGHNNSRFVNIKPAPSCSSVQAYAAPSISNGATSIIKSEPFNQLPASPSSSHFEDLIHNTTAGVLHTSAKANNTVEDRLDNEGEMTRAIDANHTRKRPRLQPELREADDELDPEDHDEEEAVSGRRRRRRPDTHNARVEQYMQQHLQLLKQQLQLSHQHLQLWNQHQIRQDAYMATLGKSMATLVETFERQCDQRQNLLETLLERRQSDNKGVNNNDSDDTK